MEFDRIAIICSGKELSWGMGLLHLFRFQTETERFINEKAGIGAEIYSAGAFRAEHIPRCTMKIFVGVAADSSPARREVFRRWGMTIESAEGEMAVKADVNGLNGAEYDRFLAYANKRRSEYLAAAEGYVRRVTEKDENWIAGTFERMGGGGLFGQSGSAKRKLRQQYDCLAFVLYLEHLAQNVK